METLKAILTQQQRVIKTFSTREEAGEALHQLVLLGFPLAQVFLLGNNCEKNLPSQALSAHTYGTITGTAAGLKQGMLLGNLVGGITGLLLGVGLIALTGVGQLALSDAIAFVLLSAGVCTAAGGLIGSLVGLGFTLHQAKVYKQQTAQGSVLLLVEGTAYEIDLARHLLEKSAA